MLAKGNNYHQEKGSTSFCDIIYCIHFSTFKFIHFSFSKNVENYKAIKNRQPCKEINTLFYHIYIFRKNVTSSTSHKTS